MKRCTRCALRYPFSDDQFCGQCGSPLITIRFFERHQAAIIIWIIVGSCVALFGISRSCETGKLPKPSTVSSQRQGVNTNALRNLPDYPSPKRVAWGYSEHADEMGRGRVFVNMISSTNTISLDSPYDGAQHARLAIREHPEHGRDVYVSIEKGQLLDSDFHSRVVVRFDDEKPISFPTVRPADLSSETLFLRGNAFSVFLSRLKTAKKLRMEVPVYQSGNQILDFDVEGFKWKEKK